MTGRTPALLVDASLHTASCVETGPDGVRLVWSAESAVTGVDLVVHRVKLDALGDPAQLRFFVNSENINNGSMGLTWAGPARCEIGRMVQESHWWALLGDPEVPQFHLFGFLTPVRHRSLLRVRDGAFEALSRIDRQVEAGEKIVSDTLVMLSGPDPLALLDTFGDRCATQTPCRPLSSDAVAWNSWDYYFAGFEHADLDENMAAIHAFNVKAPCPVEHIVIDMGWYNHVGDWRANGRFPGGIAAAAHAISAAGFTPGIWVAPFEVGYHTNAFMRTPSILVRDLEGKVVIDEWAGGPTGWLDPTCSDGERFLFNIFVTLRQAGFRYFKLDFLHFLITHAKASERCFRDETLGRMGIVRRGLEIIREAIGPDSYLLGCGCPPEAGAGIVDAMRIGGDISTYHSTVRLLAPFLAGRYWMHNRLFRNDPDFLMVRSEATSNDQQLNPFHPVNMADMFGSRSGPTWQTLGEVRLWATLATMAGGALTLADHLGKLNDEGLAILHTAMTHHAETAARPLDLMEHNLPELWWRDGAAPALAILNWEETSRTFSVPLEAHPQLREATGWINLWPGPTLAANGGHLTITLPPREAAWLMPKETPGYE